MLNSPQVSRFRAVTSRCAAAAFTHTFLHRSFTHLSRFAFLRACIFLCTHCTAHVSHVCAPSILLRFRDFRSSLGSRLFSLRTGWVRFTFCVLIFIAGCLDLLDPFAPFSAAFINSHVATFSHRALSSHFALGTSFYTRCRLHHSLFLCIFFGNSVAAITTQQVESGTASGGQQIL